MVPVKHSKKRKPYVLVFKSLVAAAAHGILGSTQTAIAFEKLCLAVGQRPSRSGISTRRFSLGEF